MTTRCGPGCQSASSACSAHVWPPPSYTRTEVGTHTRLVIEDNAGRREVLHFSFIFNPILLEKGRNLFSYNAGFQRELKGGIYQYDTKKPVLSASYLEGMTDETTLGVYTQADASRSLFGVKAVHVLDAGTLQLDLASSRSGSAKQDLAVKIDWIRIPDTRGGPAVQSQLSVEYLGKNFGAIATSSPGNKGSDPFKRTPLSEAGAGGVITCGPPAPRGAYPKLSRRG